MNGQQTPLSLDDSHYRTINEQLRKLALAKEDLDRALSGGVDCGDTPEVCAFLIQQYQQRKQAFFPNRP
jgi:hypothetical protein